MTRHCNVSLETVWNMPVMERKWWIGRTLKELKEQEERNRKKPR